MPFCAATKLVIVHDAHLFKPPQWKQVRAACEKPPARCCLVVVLPGDPRDKKFKDRIKTLHTCGEVIVCENPRGEKNVGRCAAQELARYGKQIAPDALALLGAVLEENAQSIAREAQKLALYCGDRTTVTVADVGEVVSCGVRDTVFALVDAMARSALETALPLLKNLRDTGTHPLAVLKLLARRFRQIAAVQHLLAQGASQRAVYQAMRPMPNDAIAALCRDARSWPADRMGAVFDLLFEANTLVKSSRIDGESVLTHLALRLSALRAQACAAPAA